MFTTVGLSFTLGRSSILVQVPRRNMPLCTFGTNLKATEIPNDFHKQLSKVVATTLGKDEKVIYSTPVIGCEWVFSCKQY